MELAPFLRKSQARRNSAPAPPPKPRKPGQFSIGTILVVMAMFAFALGVFQMEVSIGIGLLILVLAAIVRTIVIEVLRAYDHRMGCSTSVATELFLSVRLILIAATVAMAFFSVGLAVAFRFAGVGGRPMPTPLIWPIVAGLLLGVFVAVTFLWITRNGARDV